MSVNDIQSNKTYTELYGDHMNNVVVIGDDSKSDKFHAHAKLEFWGEDWITFEDETAFGTPALKDDVITLGMPDRKIEFYQDKKQTGVDTWSSSLKWVNTLKSKPASNKLTYHLGGGWQDFIFAYQIPFPSPTEFQRDGEEWLHQEHGGDYAPNKKGNSERPRSIDGGYRVRHKTKRDFIIDGKHKNYKTGFVLSILVTKAVDAVGKTAWCTLHIENGIMTEIIPQTFLDMATYPVRLNAEFGYHTEGNTQYNGFGSGNIQGNAWEPASDGTVDSLFWLLLNNDALVSTGGLYNDGDPGTELDVTAEFTGITDVKTWTELPYLGGYSILAVNHYVNALHMGDAIGCYYDAGAGDHEYYAVIGYVGGTVPDAPDWDVDEPGWAYSAYITYTPSGVPTDNDAIMTTNTGFWGATF